MRCLAVVRFAALSAPLCITLPAGPAAAMELGVAGTNVSLPVTSLLQNRFKNTTRQQYDFSCGSAAVATLLSYHFNQPVSEAVVFEFMFRNGDQKLIRRQGFSMLDMKRFLAARGFQADGFTLPLEKLIEARLPAIVLVSEKGYNHFVVVKGLADGRILLGDPSNGTRALALTHFRTIWQNKLLFVIHNYKGVPSFNADADWRAAPIAALSEGTGRVGLDVLTMPKHGSGEF